LQYLHYDVKRQRQRQNDSSLLLWFKFSLSGSCPQGSECNFKHDEEAWEHYQRNVCFDFLNKGKCEKVPECRFVHSLTEESAVRDAKHSRREKLSESLSLMGIISVHSSAAELILYICWLQW
jgi:hypothetical protein